LKQFLEKSYWLQKPAAEKPFILHHIKKNARKSRGRQSKKEILEITVKRTKNNDQQEGETGASKSEKR
jgi:hypothetical protein